MEAILRPMSWSDFPIGPRIGFKLFRTPGIGWFMLCVMNAFVRQILPQMTIRKLSSQEMRRYHEPFPSIRSRNAVRQFPLEIPIGRSNPRTWSNWCPHTAASCKSPSCRN